MFCASRIEGKSKVNGEAQSKTKIVEMRLNVCNLKTAKKNKTDAFLLNAKTLGPKEKGRSPDEIKCYEWLMSENKKNGFRSRIDEGGKHK